MPRTTRKEREDRRRHALEIVSGGYGWGDATKIIENTYKVSRRTAIRDVDLAFEGIVESLEKSDVKALMGWITLGVQRNILKAEQQNNHGAVISGYRLLYEMVIKPKENQGKRTGSINLIDNTLDNELIVTLPVSESLPWYAAYLAVANPIAGLGVIVGERVFRKPIEKFSSGKFKIKGNINDPEVSFLGLWDQKVEIENFLDFELEE